MLLASVLAACNSHEGLYAPACVAFAGDKIELANGQFVWEKFTDAWLIDENGNLVNQFPGYPMHGTYRVDGGVVTLKPESGESTPSVHLRRDNDRHYLLTAAQFDARKATGKYTDCPLVLGGRRRD